MEGFLRSFTPLWERYKAELILIGAAVLATIGSLVVFLQKEPAPIFIKSAHQSFANVNQTTGVIFVDLSGAVVKPAVYQLHQGSRLQDVINKAGGLSESADVVFFNRNFNAARVLSDQEKIYIPSIDEIANGIFSENRRIIDYTQPGVITTQNNSATETAGVISINNASKDELDTLPGIGPTTADKIIQGRPYASIDELQTKKILKKNVFDQIKDQVSL